MWYWAYVYAGVPVRILVTQLNSRTRLEPANLAQALIWPCRLFRLAKRSKVKVTGSVLACGEVLLIDRVRYYGHTAIQTAKQLPLVAVAFAPPPRPRFYSVVITRNFAKYWVGLTYSSDAVVIRIEVVQYNTVIQ